MDDIVGGFSVGAGVTTLFALLFSAVAESNERQGCKQTTQEECVYVGYLSESQVEMLKKKNKTKEKTVE